MKKYKKRLTALFLALAVVCAMGMSLAYFTDHEKATATATAGTLDLTLTESWAHDNTSSTDDDAKPGDIYDLSYTLKNDGNKSADVRETFVITSDVQLAAGSPAEFEIYAASDVKKDGNGFYVPISGAQPLSVRTTGSYPGTDGKTYYTITYKVPEFILNGTGDNAETETGALGTQKVGSYVILFAKNASNAFQGVNVTIDYLAEAKQHRNTDPTIWTTVASESITLGGGSVSVVPAA